MVKIVLIDDEYYTRLAISKSTPWEDLGYVLVGEAENGLEGLDLIKKEEPDVALIDINMPMMDGLTLVKEVKELGLSTRCIMLTGYSEFNYAREALRLSVSNYLLKPVNQEELHNELRKLFKEVLYTKRWEQEQFIKKMVNESRDLDLKQVPDSLKNMKGFCLMTLYHHVEQALENSPHDRRKKLYQILEEGEECQGVILWNGDGGLLHGIIGGNEEDMTLAIESLESYKMKWDKKHGKVIICLSERCNSFNQVKEIYDAHSRVMANKLFINSEQILIVHEDHFNKDCGYKGLGDKEKKTFFRLLRERDEEKLAIFLHEQLEQIKGKGYTIKILEYFIQELLTKAYEHMEECQQKEEVESYPQQEWSVLLNKAIDLSEVEEKLRAFFIGFIDKLTMMEVSESDLLVDKIKEYVESHYQEQDCNIQKVVEYFCFSYHYLCKLFKSRTGDTLGEFIITTRMDMAKKKILHGERNIETLAGDCGYADSRYFSKCFKKFYGITPSRYIKQTRVF